MPNHITNIIEIVDLGGVNLKDVRKAFLNDKNHVDFSVIHPVPECLKDFEPHSGITTLAEALIQTPINAHPLIAALERSNRETCIEKIHDISDGDWLQVKRAISNHQQCGYMYWYEWNNANWGTKWNAYSQPDEGHPEGAATYQFETAWSHPFGLIETISKNLPSVTFNISYADEDLGSNVGTYTIKNGVTSLEDIAPSYRDMTDEQKKHFTALAWSINHKDEDPRSYGYNENWEYSDETHESFEREQVEKSGD